MERHVANARRVAEFLETHVNVERVTYPGLDSFPQKELADRQASGHGSMLWFEVRGGVAEIRWLCVETGFLVATD